MTEERLREIAKSKWLIPDDSIAAELRAHADELAGLRKDRERFKKLLNAVVNGEWTFNHRYYCDSLHDGDRAVVR